MTEKKHDIDPWFIPDDEEIVLGQPRGEAEQEHYEENGELLDDEEPEVCPHCGEPYKTENNGFYTHAYVRKDVGEILETDYCWKPGVICTPSGDKNFENGYRKADSMDIR